MWTAMNKIYTDKNNQEALFFNGTTTCVHVYTYVLIRTHLYTYVHLSTPKYAYVSKETLLHTHVHMYQRDLIS